MGWWRDSWVGETLGFLWHYGGRTLLGGGLGGAAGLALGLVIVGFGFWWLCVRRARQREVASHLANWLVWLVWLSIVPAALALAGASLGASGVVYSAVQDADALERAVELALDSTAAVLADEGDESESEEGNEEDWRQAAVSLLEGEERFALEEVPERLELLQRAAEQWAAQQSQRFMDEEEGRPGRAGFLARRLLRRLGRLPMQTVNGLWLDPVVAELEASYVDEAGEIDGRELTLAVVRVHVQGPVARAARTSLVVQALVLIAIAAAVVFLPLPLLAWLARRQSRESVGVAAQ